MYAYSQLEYEDQMIDEIIENEMHNLRETTLKNLSKIMHLETKLLTGILSFAWFESQADAVLLAEKLNLCKLDFLAMKEDFDGFKEEYLKNLDKAENF